MEKLQYFFLLHFTFLPSLVLPWTQTSSHFNQPNNYEGSSDLINLEYHMGPVLSSPINLYIIWYGHWNPSHQSTIRDFIYSLSSPSTFPSVSDWWKTLTLYTDQTASNITSTVHLSGEFYDSSYSHGAYISRLGIQSIIKRALTSNPNPLPLNTFNGLYLILTSYDVKVEDFCREVCGFHYFTFPKIVGSTLPYAWVGYSGEQCPGLCAYPFAMPKFGGRKDDYIMKAPNGDVGIDGMVSVIGHELAEVTSNPLVNGWYAGDEPSAPTEVADLCVGVFGSGGGGGYVGKVDKDYWGNGFNVNGVNGRKFLVQWVWNPLKRRCFGPNAID